MVPSPPLPAIAPFELSGGALCLDFVNTRGDRGRPATDALRSYAHLLAFSGQAGTLDPTAGERLRERAAARPGAGEAALAAANALRESLYRIFSARARGRPTAAEDLDRLNATLRDAHAHLRLGSSDDGFAWCWEDPSASLFAPIWPLARSAAELLTSAELALVRECDGASCNWLFLDRSRGRSRRWCSMESCGNRAKARRHYRRRRAEERPTSP